jgi:hypothetical protein
VLYSNYVDIQLNSSHDITKQEATIGKAVWNQVTTVVILERKGLNHGRFSVENRITTPEI